MAARQIAIAVLFPLWAAALPLALPPRPTDAPAGRAFAAQIQSLSAADRDAEISRQILAGNVPSFLRQFCPVSVTNVADGATNWVTFYVAPDYLGVGTDDDFLLTPLRPGAAQELADQLNASLPTPRMVDEIYRAADLKLAPLPIPASPLMTTVPVFLRHSDMIQAQRRAWSTNHPPGVLTAGDKKDVVITARLATAPGKVAIYGWQRTNGEPIQPLFLGHSDQWADYSHGIRLVQQEIILNGTNSSIRRVLADPKLCALLSDEGPIEEPRYAAFGERTTTLAVDSDVKIEVNLPEDAAFASHRPVWLIFYALPNGNTIAQTAGRKLAPGEDWHFDIQHIAAQTRFLRSVVTNKTIVVAYLQAAGKSWPAWRAQHGNQEIPQIFARVLSLFKTNNVEVTLAGHSGGGSLLFGYLDAVDRIPDQIQRIAFLDADYAYDAARGHARKLTAWLEASTSNALCVLAYDDADARLNGRPFVSAAGGTWGRSHALWNDLAATFPFTSQTNSAGLETHTALQGRVQFLLHENPERKILHTLQVDRNGFIHAMLIASPQEDIGYRYFGARAYTNWIR